MAHRGYDAGMMIVEAADQTNEPFAKDGGAAPSTPSKRVPHLPDAWKRTTPEGRWRSFVARLLHDQGRRVPDRAFAAEVAPLTRADDTSFHA
jgi:hypothetical protein